MELMIGGCIGFLLVHLGVSGTPLRGLLIGLMGDKAYLGVYSVLSLATFGVMITGYGQVEHIDFVWMPDPMFYKITKVLVLIAFLFVVMGAFTKNPTAVMNEQALEAEIAGMLKITRHPIQWGILTFSVAHIISNGDVASLIFFGTLIPGPFRAFAVALWPTLFPEHVAEMAIFGFVQHNFFLLFNAGIGLIFLKRANRELFSGEAQTPPAES